MIEDIIKTADEKLDPVIVALKKEFDGIRAGRASVSSIENITIDYYGVPTIIKSLANLSLSGPRAIQITPYDKSSVKPIEKELSDNPSVDANVSSDGVSVYMTLPEMTGEKRQDYVKDASKSAETAKVSARNVRHILHQEIDTFKEGSSEDDIKAAKSQIDKKIQIVVSEIDKLFKEKEQQILSN
jgi:ribosome recycling factor